MGIESEKDGEEERKIEGEREVGRKEERKGMVTMRPRTLLGLSVALEELAAS